MPDFVFDDPEMNTAPGSSRPKVGLPVHKVARTTTPSPVKASTPKDLPPPEEEAAPGGEDAGFSFDDPEMNTPYTAAAPGPSGKSALKESAIRSTGNVLSQTGRALRDVGLPTKGVEEYGTKLAEEHPAEVNTLAEAAKSPWQTTKEAVGELAPQIGLNLAGAAAGARVGALAGAPFEGVGAAPGAVVGGLIGGFAPNFLQEYGGIRQTQDQTGKDNIPLALAAGGAAAGVDLLEPETAFARKLVTGSLNKVGEKGLVATGKAVAKGLAKEALGETVQTGLERVGAEQDLTGPGALDDYAISAIKGGIGGGVVGGVEHHVSPRHGQASAEPQTLPEDEEAAAPAGPLPTPAKVDQTRQGDRPQGLFDVDHVLDNGIASVETGGRPERVSEKGAEGKHQLLPATAKQVAERLGVPFDEDRLLHDPDYNRMLARAHLDQLRKHYNGDMFLAVTAYHAGQGNVDNWVTRFKYDPSDPEAFLTQVAPIAPRSAEYPQKVMAAMGGDLGMASEGGGEVAGGAAPDEFDTSPDSVLKFIRANASDTEEPAPTTEATKKLATAIAAGGDQAAAALAAERKAIDARMQALTAQEGTVEPEKINAQLGRLASREKVLTAAVEAARRAEGQRQREGGLQGDLFAPPAAAPVTPVAAAPAAGPGVNLVTEPAKAPFGRRPTMAGEPDFNPNPDLMRAADTTLADRLRMEEANSKSARTQAEGPAVAAAQSAAEKSERSRVLAKILSNPNVSDPRADFKAHMEHLTFSPDLTTEEEARIRSE
jgi:hypothetical protein